MLMEQSSAVDLDSLLQSHSEITSDENSPDWHYRTIDEILLNYSSSPSPPSSPSTSYSAHQHSRSNLKDDDYVSTGVGSSRNQRWSHSPSSTLVESDKYNPAAGPASNSNRTKSMGRVLPQLFGRGAISSKPGAALAAAAAASRSITTPHATAIKLRRATTGVLQRPVSETTEKVAASDDSSLSPSAVASRVSENGSEDGEVKLEQFLMGNTNADSQKTDAGVGYSAGDRIQENSDKVAEDATNSKTLSEAADDNGKPRVDEDDECKMTTSESQKASPIENEKDLALDKVNVNEQVIFPLLDENVEEYPADESGNNDKSLGPTTILTDDDHKEDLTGGEEASDFGNVVAGTGDGDAASTQSVVADMLGDLALTPEKKGHHTNLQQNSHLSLKPLDLAEEIEKKQAFTGLHYEEGAAAQPMRLEGVPRGSTVLGYFDVDPNNAITQTISSQAFRREHGSPQVVAVHLNYIAVGMSRGSIFVQPSKYTAHQVDNMDGKMMSLGLQGDRSHVPVTSMCFNQQGDLLFAGYGDGHYTVWDVQKASALKVITEHRAPVVHMLYLGQDTQVTRQFNVVSGDSKGVVKLIRFSVVPWLNRISYTKSMKLLDETTSRVVCASPLLYGEGHAGAMIPSPSSSALTTASISSMMGAMVDEGVVIFITHQSALVAKVSPAVEVYAHIPRPDSVRDGAMPYATWRCMSQSLGSSSENAPVETSDKVSLLAIAWDREVQVAKLLNSELKVLEKWTLEYAAIGLAWLGDEMLAVLTLTAQLYLFAKDGILIHQMSCSFDGFRGDDLISYHIYFTDAFGNPEKAYHNSVAVRGATIYVLGPEHLIVFRLLSWKERIEVLRKAGDWMGALNMAMTLYDGASPGVIDLPKNLDDIQRIVMPYLVELLQSYVTEEQYTRVGGVAIEFCVHIRRTDILFDDIMSKFDDAHHKETFLELLEPYILKDMLGSLPPEIMQALVEHYSKRGWLQRIEQCVLHMDILSLDFNQIVRLCREHRLHCALIYLFNKGLDDFRTPIEELLVVLRNSVGENATCLGYRMLVYLKYCFKGLAFPPGRGNLSPTRLPSLKKELLHFLLEDSSAPNSWAVTRLPPNRAYANLLHLLELDTEATLEVLKCAFTDVELPKSTPPFLEPTSFNMESAESQKLVQKVVDILSDILDATYFQAGSPICSNDLDLVELWPSKKDVGHMFDFIAYYIAYEQAKVPRDILSQILEYLTSEINISDTVSGTTIEIFKRRERQLLSLLKVVPETDWDAPYLLYLCEKAQFHQVCGYIHAIRHQYIAALDSYMKVNHEPIYAFSFIHDMLRLLSNGECDAFESAVISRIPDLFKLSREATYILIIDHFSGRTQYIFSELRSHPESLFLYLKTVNEVHTTGNLNLSCLGKVDVLDFPSAKRAHQQSTGVQAYLETISRSIKLLHNNQVNMTDEMTELYFELLCRYDRESVLKFLETSESYRVEHCLHLCQEYGIVDAASFLLERVGDVGSALLLILSNVSDKFVMLDAEIEKTFSDTVVNNLNAVLKIKVVAEILDVVHACIGLCQRNSPRLKPEESEYLWFQLLDSFCEPLMDSGNARTDSESEALQDTLDGSMGELEYKEGFKFKWKVSKFHKGADIMRKLFAIFIKEIVEGMIGYVRLPRIMWKLLSDNGNQEFGDFKLTILGMLGTYDFERRILDAAKSLIEDDTYYTMSLLRKGASHGYAPRSLVCCICNSFLTKNSADSSVQLFSCGHAMHLHCELQENGASFRGTISGCPVCIPSKKAQRSSGKSMLAENGLVSRSSSRTQQARGSPALHPHDHESADNSYSLHPPSRFELLHNLEKDQKLIQIENVPQLRLAPPALYHEKVKKGIVILAGESTSTSTTEKARRRRLGDVKVKGSLPLKSNIFGKGKISRR
ncbi:Vacuolar protein sorting-associated protein 8 [Sesamum alatum]|uniref:Vacuolar protein sorting-associated protein 8 n=1 Tax=Sesamum alatum TaxID=300844 RepID=A0AAE1Y7P1_9LAMI|nr:Vacuolar protein sorting-associated protein 8 [Sesamum alatum]